MESDKEVKMWLKTKQAPNRIINIQINVSSNKSQFLSPSRSESQTVSPEQCCKFRVISCTFAHLSLQGRSNPPSGQLLCCGLLKCRKTEGEGRSQKSQAKALGSTQLPPQQISCNSAFKGKTQKTLEMGTSGSKRQLYFENYKEALQLKQQSEFCIVQVMSHFHMLPGQLNKPLCFS